MIEQEQNQHHFTPEEAAAFLRTPWCRVHAPDGSTIAYCPDLATARKVDAIEDLLQTAEWVIGKSNSQYIPGDLILKAFAALAKAGR